MTKEDITDSVLNRLKELNETLPEKQKFTVNAATTIFGDGSSIDSLSLVSLIVDLEMLFSEEHGFEISLTDDRAMTRKISPYQNVTSLVDYIFEIISEK